MPGGAIAKPGVNARSVSYPDPGRALRTRSVTPDDAMIVCAGILRKNPNLFSKGVTKNRWLGNLDKVVFSIERECHHGFRLRVASKTNEENQYDGPDNTAVKPKAYYPT